VAKNGGARPGAGRPKGSANKKTQEIVAKALEQGITPLEYMLGVMRDVAADTERRDDMAKACAPYLHPRLQAVEHSGKDGGDIGIVAKIERVIVKPNAKD
jgi:hypothetical protein